MGKCDICQREGLDGFNFRIEDGNMLFCCYNCNFRLSNAEFTELRLKGDYINEDMIRLKFRDLYKWIRNLNSRMDFLYRLDQLDNSEIVYKMNLNNLVDQLEYYNAYMLKKLLKILELRKEIDEEKARESMGLTKETIKDSMLSLFNGDANKLMNWTEKNFPKFHKEVLDEIAKKQDEN